MATHVRASYVAVDLGASSGRVIVGELGDRVMRLYEVHRFPTTIDAQDGRLRWNFEQICAEIDTGIAQARREFPNVRSISVDSWGVDYVPFDAQWRALRAPYAYRDPRTAGALNAVLARIPAATLYDVTGTQFLPFNTLLQVYCDLRDEPDEVRQTAARLLIADAVLHRLSGVGIAEQTLASTTQLYDVRQGRWSSRVLEAIGDDPRRWPAIVAPGTVLGPLRCAVPADGAPPQVIATCSHDTAAAIAAVPAQREEAWAYCSSGTWSLLGIERDVPILTAAAREAGFTNEVGLDESIRFLKNRTGMWVLEECMREWDEHGARPSWESLFAEASQVAHEGPSLDLNAPPFAERGSMVAKVHAACLDAGIGVPASRGALASLVLTSLAESYRETLQQLAVFADTPLSVLYVVGGGARNALLNQLTADACQCRVVAGPVEATVLGNLLVQARAMGDLPTGVTVRDVARASSTLTEFRPRIAGAPALGARLGASYPS
jgi:rhamnulokinase